MIRIDIREIQRKISLIFFMDIIGENSVNMVEMDHQW